MGSPQPVARRGLLLRGGGMLGLKAIARFPFIVRAGQHDMPANARRVGVASANDLGGRTVPGNALSDWYLCLPDLLEPKQVSMILRGALAGNLWQQTQLTQKIFDTWPTFRKALTELRSAVKMVRFKVSPYLAEDGTSPTKSAIAKQQLVRRAFAGFDPDRFKDEDGFKGMIFDLTDAIANGVSIVELLWALNRPGPKGPEHGIRASAWVHPRHYGVKADGSIGVEAEYRGDPMAFNSMYEKRILDNPSKYIVAKYKSKSGSPLGAGEVRCLALSWVNIIYATDWLRNMGQKYGAPFIAIPYTPGIPESERERFVLAAQRCAAQGWMIYPRNSPDMKPDIYPAQAMTGDNPIRVMVDLAEKWCVQLLLGQTLTSDVGAKGGGGSYALGEVHAGVKQEKLEAIADWIAEILEEQLAGRLVAENFGEGSGEVPKIEADFTQVETPLQAAQRVGIVTSQCRVPVLAEEVYRMLGLTQPMPGDEVISNGQLALQDQPMTEVMRWQQSMQRQVKQAEVQMALQAEAAGYVPQSGGGEPEEPVEEEGEALAASRPINGMVLRNVLQAATPEQLEQLEPLVIKARKSGSHNGEWQAVKVLVKQIADNNRIKLYE